MMTEPITKPLPCIVCGFQPEAASMCWENPAGAGVFESSRAAALADALHQHIQLNRSHAPRPDPARRPDVIIAVANALADMAYHDQLGHSSSRQRVADCVAALRGEWVDGSEFNELLGFRAPAGPPSSTAAVDIERCARALFEHQRTTNGLDTSWDAEVRRHDQWRAAARAVLAEASGSVAGAPDGRDAPDGPVVIERCAQAAAEAYLTDRTCVRFTVVSLGVVGERAYRQGQKLHAERGQLAKAARWLRVNAADEFEKVEKAYASRHCSTRWRCTGRISWTRSSGKRSLPAGRSPASASGPDGQAPRLAAASNPAESGAGNSATTPFLVRPQERVTSAVALTTRAGGLDAAGLTGPAPRRYIDRTFHS